MAGKVVRPIRFENQDNLLKKKKNGHIKSLYILSHTKVSCRVKQWICCNYSIYNLIWTDNSIESKWV